MHSRQLILERSFLHGSDRDLVLSVKSSGHAHRPGFCLYRLKVQAKKQPEQQNSRKLSNINQNAGNNKSSTSPASDRNQRSLEELAAAAAVGAQRAADDDWIDIEDDVDDEDDALDDDHLKRFKGLVLDLTYRPINVVNWKRSLCLEILEKAEVLVYYDQIVYSPSRAFFVPAVLRMSGYVYAPKAKHRRLSLSKTNIFIRDKFRCQYCDHDRDLTIDHVHPVSKGGGHSWDNLVFFSILFILCERKMHCECWKVTACKFCNGKKGSRTLEDAHMKLERLPKEPTAIEGRELPPSYRVFKSIVLNTVPSEWVDYLPRRPNKMDFF